MRKILFSEDRLDALRKGDPAHSWRSLDDRRSCILCEKTFSGRAVEISISAQGRVRLRCPSESCPGTPHEWVHPGNPLVSQKAWRDWSRLLDADETGRRRISSPSSKPPYNRPAA
ncbi:MAG TPA: hypothetical protein VK474_09205 [Chthoniobacterales bacterium]|nr:hypothetical protein [Chthoniobacterales bacterium]